MPPRAQPYARLDCESIRPRDTVPATVATVQDIKSVASVSVTEEIVEQVPGPQAPFAVRVIIVLFVLSYMIATLWLLLDAWVFGSMRLRWLLGMNGDAPLPSVFLSAFHAMLGAVLGAGALGIVSFHHYTSIKGDFQSRHVWGYFVAPVLASVLGLVVFALLQSGLLVFAGGGSADKADDLARLGYLAVGFLAGFGWYEATQAIQRIVKRFFSSDDPNSDTRTQIAD